MYFNEGSSALKFLDEQLAGRDWLVGNEPTVADVDAYAVVAFAGIGFSLKELANLRLDETDCLECLNSLPAARRVGWLVGD